MEKVEQNEAIETVPIEKILLDSKIEKYKLVAIATRWIEEIGKKEEYKYLTFNQILEMALRDIVTGKVSIEDIQKLPPVERKKTRDSLPSFIAKKETKETPREYREKKK